MLHSSTCTQYYLWNFSQDLVYVQDVDILYALPSNQNVFIRHTAVPRISYAGNSTPGKHRSLLVQINL